MSDPISGPEGRVEALIASKLEDAAGPGETIMSTTVYTNKPAYLNKSNGWIITKKLPGNFPKCYSTTQVFAEENPPPPA